MKKLLMGAIVLSCFAIALTLFQMSCKKDATAQTGSSATQLNKVIFVKSLFVNGSYTGVCEIWTCNYDGTGVAKVNITLPSGVYYSDGMIPAMSPNGQKIFFTASTLTGNTSSGNTPFYGDLYSCNSDGTSVTKIVDRAGGSINMGEAY